MKLNLGAASFFALALFTMPLSAQQAQPAKSPPAVAAPKAVEQAVPQEVLALLADTRPINELSLDELRKRVKTAKHFAQDQALPPDLRNQLKSLAEASLAELAGRQQAAEQKTAGDQAAKEKAAADKSAKDQAAADKAAANKAAQEQAAVEKGAKNQAALDKAAANKAAQQQAAVDKATKDQAAIDQAAAEKAAQEQAAADKSANEQTAADKAAADQAAKEQAVAAKAAKLKAAADKAAAAKVIKDQAAIDKAAADKAVADKGAADKAAKEQVAAAKAAADKTAKEQVAAEKAAADQAAADQVAAVKAAKDQAAAQNAQPAPVAKPPVVEVVPAVPAPKPPVAEAAPPVPAIEAPPPKLVVKAPPVPKVVPPPPPPPPVSKALPQVAVVAPPPLPVVAPSAADAKALDSNIIDPASEKQAQTYLADKSDVSKLSDDDFRKRLDAIRELMTANELSRETERAVRIKLKTEREVLRQRIAQVEAAQQLKNAQAAAANPPPVVPGAAPKPKAPASTTNNTTNNTTINNTNIITVLTPPQEVLRDRRPAENLDVSELQIRIQIFGDAQSTDAYDQSYRDYWRASVDRDRAILRRRLIEERHRREAEMAMQAADDSFEISNDYVPSDRPHRDVFAAEIDYREMEDVLVAPPRQFSGNPQQRYKVEEIAVQPKLRNSISRIEIDTIRFGSNEAFIRDEQVGNLDGIAAIIEKIVKKYPNEVFLIEGHTDAPGSDGYNSRLSKLRAESIKEALVSYYVIPAKNLRTVGLGERFLKIPTADAEPENRRVSIARITPLLVQR